MSRGRRGAHPAATRQNLTDAFGFKADLLASARDAT
jgi:hypothetical protein